MEPRYPADQQKVVDLLQKLSKMDAEYPVDLLAQRRAVFLSSVSAVMLKPHIKAGKGHGPGHGGLSSASSQLLLQSFLVVILVVEIAIGAYVLRDKWLPLLRHSTPIPIPTYPLSQPTSALAPTIISTPSAIPTGTVLPTATLIPGAPTDSGSNPVVPTDSGSNPVVPENTEKGNPGKHLGQTPGPPEPPTPKKGP